MKNEIRHTGTIEIETERLLLRAYTLNDVEQFVERAEYVSIQIGKTYCNATQHYENADEGK